MAKEIVRTAIGAAEVAAVGVKQSKLDALLLKKKAGDLAGKEKDSPEHVAEADGVDHAAASTDAAAVEVADASDALGIASDAGINPSVLLTGASYAGDAPSYNETGGISNTTLLVGGGVLLAGGAIAIAGHGGGHNNNGNGDGDGNGPTPAVITVVGSLTGLVDEGQQVVFTVTGTPGSTFLWTVDGAHVNDVANPTGNVTIGADGKGSFSVITLADNTTEGLESFKVTVGGVDSGGVLINDSSLTPTPPPPPPPPPPPSPEVMTVSPSTGSVDEGQQVVFTVTGTPGSVFSWSVDAGHVNDVDVATGNVIIGADGKGTFAVAAINDGLTEGAETFKVTVGGVDSSFVLINDTSNGNPVPPPSPIVTSVTPSANAINEGQQVVFTVHGTPGAVLAWSVNPAHVNDVNSATGNVVIGDDGTGTFAVMAINDNLTEGPEPFHVTVGGVTSSDVIINDTSINPPPVVITVTPSALAVDEGQPVIFTVTGTPGSTLAWSVDPTHLSDVAPFTGNVLIGADGTGTFGVVALNDNLTEGPEAFHVTVGGVTSVDVTINDTSLNPPPVVVTITPSTDAIDEGQLVVFTVTGTPGSTLAWTVNTDRFGDVTPVTGNVLIGDDGTGTFVVTAINDNLTEGPEILTATVGGVTSSDVTINDTSLTPDIVYVLTPQQDNLQLGANLGTDVVNATVGSAFDVDDPTDTFTNGDVIAGNGKTVLEISLLPSLLVDDAYGFVAATKVSNVDRVDIESNLAGTVFFDAADWTDIGSVNLSGDGLLGPTIVEVLGLEAGTDLSVKSGSDINNPNPFIGAAALGVLYDDKSVAILIADGEGSAVNFVDGDVTGNAVEDGTAIFGLLDPALANITGGLFPIPIGLGGNAPNLDLTIGDATLIGTGAAVGLVAVLNGQDKGGNVTAGDVSVTGFDAAGVFIGGFSHTADSAAVDVTVGNVTVANNVDGFGVGVIIGNSGENQVGKLTAGDILATLTSNSVGGLVTVTSTVVNDDVSDDVSVDDFLVGNITVNAGDNISLPLTVGAGVQAFADKGDITVGNVTIGDVSVTIGDPSSATVNLGISATASSGDIETGALVIGSVELAVGTLSSITATIGVTLQVTNTTGAGSATAGPVTIGDVSLVQGIDSTADILIGSVVNIARGVATVGDFSVGKLDFDVPLHTALEGAVVVSATASQTGSAEVGNVSIGGIDIALDDGAGLIANGGGDHYFEVGVRAFGTAGGTIGTVDIGDIDLKANASLSSTGHLSISISANGDIGDISVGNVSVSTGIDSALQVNLSVSASNSGSIGNVRIGDVSLTAADESHVAMNHGKASFTAQLYADSDIGDINIGNVSLSALGDASASFTVFATAETIGDISIGNIDISEISAFPPSDPMYTVNPAIVKIFAGVIQDSVTNSIGTIDVGDIAIEVNGPKSYGQAAIYAGGLFGIPADAIGTMTVGNLDLSVGNDVDNATGALLSVSITNTLSDVSIGNISVVGTTVQGLGDANTYSAALHFNAGGDLTIGNIEIAGGDGLADNFDNFGGLFTLSTGGDLTITGIDYSGYGSGTTGIGGVIAAGVTVDLTAGPLANADVTSVVGTSFNDVLKDNAGTTTLTGGFGADTFEFSTLNNHLTAASADKVTDFNEGAGDRLDINYTGVLDYAEGTAASFAVFLTDANASNTTVYVGVVDAGHTYVAVDYNNDDAVDYVVQLTSVPLAVIDSGAFIP